MIVNNRVDVHRGGMGGFNLGTQSGTPNALANNPNPERDIDRALYVALPETVRRSIQSCDPTLRARATLSHVAHVTNMRPCNRFKNRRVNSFTFYADHMKATAFRRFRCYLPPLRLLSRRMSRSRSRLSR